MVCEEEAYISYAVHTQLIDAFTRGDANEISLIDPPSWLRSYLKVFMSLYSLVWMYLGYPIPCCSVKKFSSLLRQEVFTTSRFHYF